MDTEEEELDRWFQRVNAAQISKDQAGVFSVLAAYERGELKREVPSRRKRPGQVKGSKLLVDLGDGQPLLIGGPPSNTTSLSGAAAALAAKQNAELAVLIHNLAVDARRLFRLTWGEEGQSALTNQWANLEELAKTLQVELEGPRPKLREKW